MPPSFMIKINNNDWIALMSSAETLMVHLVRGEPILYSYGRTVDMRIH
jgi:hypothetical protein